ncbi:aromatase/cyclase [Saccharopolyspora phatthalungensis]|uniref:Aromatase n=1 Tax=Saccharopolyspora phatthalungensis TaxID=664693 RepID=A0A840Q670_9PSEU|nr:aromatase/cyclase [Saccharopolyspora phatthalungensis]MBB5158012.1 aromatase [Saccharopolyspora phatthalungensis]
MTESAKPTTHHQQHTTVVAAAADVLYALIADATRWPVLLGPTVHVEREADHGDRETLRLWATANDSVRTWTSERVKDPDELKIVFRQLSSPAPLASMGGQWRLERISDQETRAVLDHDFSVAGDRPEDVEWFRTAVDRNSTAELAAMKRLAENWELQDELTMSFADSVHIGAPAEAVFAYLDEAEKWPERIPHVGRLDLTEPEPGLQVMEMDTTTADGSTHTTRSVRVCFPTNRIVYKQIETPELMRAHTGSWSLAQTAGGVVVTAEHTVVIEPLAVTKVLGQDATLATARTFIRKALGRNSTTTLQCAKAFTESDGR